MMAPLTRRAIGRSQSGFTMVEVLVSIMLCSISVIGIVALFRVQTNASGVSRRMTEASVLAEDQIERVRTQVAPVVATSGTQTGLDEKGKIVAGGPFTREWTVTPNGTFCDVMVRVSWNEDGPRQVVVRGRRNL